MFISNWKEGEERGAIDAIAAKCGTDKASTEPRGHGYTRWYESLFAGNEAKPLRLLEIGVGHGAHSLRLWEQYLPHADITGADIRPEVVAEAKGRFRAVLCDCGNVSTLANTFVDDRFDIIIDDGSHRCDDVFTALNFFWPRLKPGGWYAIEDLSCHADDYFTDLVPPLDTPTNAATFSARMKLALVLLRASRLQIFPSQLRNDQGTGGQCLAVLHK